MRLGNVGTRADEALLEGQQEHAGQFSRTGEHRLTLAGVQYLRGLCALLVVVSHENGFLGFPEYFGRAPLPSLHEAAVFAVATFFAISGFIIVVASIDADGQALLSKSAFFKKRAVRILPFLWLSTLAYTLLRYVGTREIDFAAALRTVVLWPTGELRPNVAWSLRHEAIFYVVFAITMLGAIRRPLWLIAWALAPLIVGQVIVQDPARPLDLDPLSGTAAFRNLIGGGDNAANLQFLGGMLVGVAYLKGWCRTSFSGSFLPVLFLGSCILVLVIPSVSGVGKQMLWTALASLIVYVACCTRPARSKAGRLGIIAGDASFSIYLTHNLVMLVLLEASTRLGISLRTQVELGGYLIGCVFVTFVVCCVVHYWVERPMISLVNSAIINMPIRRTWGSA